MAVINSRLIFLATQVCELRAAIVRPDWGKGSHRLARPAPFQRQSTPDGSAIALTTHTKARHCHMRRDGAPPGEIQWPAKAAVSFPGGGERLYWRACFPQAHIRSMYALTTDVVPPSLFIGQAMGRFFFAKFPAFGNMPMSAKKREKRFSVFHRLFFWFALYFWFSSPMGAKIATRATSTH